MTKKPPSTCSSLILFSRSTARCARSFSSRLASLSGRVSLRASGDVGSTSGRFPILKIPSDSCLPDRRLELSGRLVLVSVCEDVCGWEDETLPVKLVDPA